MLILLAGCTSSDPTAPPELTRIAATPTNIWYSDPCVLDASFSCHSQLDDTIYWMYETGGEVYTAAGYCPDGCSTWPLGFATRNKVNAAISQRIQRGFYPCEDVYQYLVASVGADRIRHFPDNLGPSDTHMSGSDPTRNDIHIRNSFFLDGNEAELARVLMHEAAHGINYPNTDQGVAIGWASLCAKAP